MIISYVIRKLPYTVRSGSAFLYQMDPFVEEASINLGVSPYEDLLHGHGADDAARHYVPARFSAGLPASTS